MGRRGSGRALPSWWVVAVVVAVVFHGCADVAPQEEGPAPAPTAAPSYSEPSEPAETSEPRRAGAAVSSPFVPRRPEEPTLAPAVVGWAGPRPHRTVAYPTRVALSPDLQLFVTDARLGAVFVYDADSKPIGEIDGLETPLGVAASSERIFVGSDGADAVLVYDMSGALVRTIRGVPMPNDLALAPDGTLFVADSLAHRVRVYGADGVHRRDIPVEDAGGAGFPAAVALLRGTGGLALAVADQVGKTVRVYDLAGAELQRIGGPVTDTEWEGRFVRPQGLATGPDGSLHVLDSYTGLVQIFDPGDGAYRGRYGAPGAGEAPRGLTLGLTVVGDTRTVVTAAAAGRLEVLHADR